MNLVYLTSELKNSYINDINSSDVEIDTDIIDYINIINKFPFICTTQCCQGHPNDGYLSVMIDKDYVNWFENIVVGEIVTYCEDIFKRFENIYINKIIVRYIFRFKDNCTHEFFNSFIKLLNENTYPH